MTFDPQKAIDHLREVVRRERMQGAQMVRVLVVEDDENDAYFILRVLEKFPVNAVWTRSGLDALDAITRNGFMVVFLDIKLSGMDGLEVIRRLKECKNEACIVGVTGHDLDTVKEVVDELGSAMVIKKPVTEEIISNMLGLSARKERVIND